MVNMGYEKGIRTCNGIRILFLLCDCSKSNEQPVNTVHENKTEQATIPSNSTAKKESQAVYTSSQIKKQFYSRFVISSV